MASLNDHHFMKLAIEEAQSGAAIGEPPFGALIVDANQHVVVRAHDTVVASSDMSKHSEIEAVRAACAVRGPDLSGCTLYCTTEPCAMCFTAAWLARISRIVYGSTIQDIYELTGGGQREIRIPVTEMNARSGEPVQLEGGVLLQECLALFHPKEVQL